MPVPRRLAVLLVLTSVTSLVVAAEGSLPYPEIEDPFGLGPRLALIDHLREGLGLEPPTGATLDELLEQYWAHQGADALAIARGETPPSAIEERWEAAAHEGERAWKLRTALLDHYDIHAPDDADLATLERLLAAAEARDLAERRAAVDEAFGVEPPPAERPTVVVVEELVTTTRSPSAGDAGRDPLASWRRSVDDCWQRYAATSRPWPVRWPGDILPAESDGFRIEDEQGTITLVDAAPVGPEGIQRYWWARLSNGRAASAYVWQPAAWDPQRGEWLSTPLEHHRLGAVSSAWTTLMNAIVQHPGLADSGAAGWMALHQAQLRALLAGDDATAEAAACAAALAPARDLLALDLAAQQAQAAELFVAITAWQAYERQLPACQTGNTLPSTEAQQARWIELVERAQAIMADQRGDMERIVARLTRGD